MLLCLNWRCSYSSRMIKAINTSESRKSEGGGQECSSMQQLMKREILAEAIRTALIDTSFIMLLCLDYSSIYNRQLTNKTSIFQREAIENSFFKTEQQLAKPAYYNILMQQSKNKRLKRDTKTSYLASHIGERVSMLSPNRSPDTKSKLNAPQPSYLKEFKKNKIKLNTLSSIGSLGIEDQIKKEIAQVNDVLKECQLKLHVSNYFGSEKEELIFLEELIKSKDETIKNLGLQIQQLKKNDRNVAEQESHSSGNKNTTDNSDKERIFKLAEQIKSEKEDLSKLMHEHTQRHNGYLKIKKLIEELEQKYTKTQGKNKEELYSGPPLLTYEEFKEKAKQRKEEPNNNKVKKIDFYHQVPPQKQQANSSKNMKDLIARKNITLTALKNSRKKHAVQMNELIAKLDFLKDEDAHLNEKIKEKQQQLANMQRKFSEKRGENHRNQLLHFRS